MRRKILAFVFAAAVIGLLAGTLSVYAAPADRSTSDVQRFSDDSTVDGSLSKLVRTDRGVSMTIHTSDLDPGPHTNWWVIFNNPAACSGGVCGEDDVFVFDNGNLIGTPGVNLSILRAAGNIVGNNGVGNFAGHLNVGDTTEQIGGSGNGLENPRGAEIHLIVRSHEGKVTPGEVDDQIHTVNGGCPPNTCTDVQFAIHMP
jgi:hypothetical protein